MSAAAVCRLSRVRTRCRAAIIISSAEVKAVETAMPLAKALGCAHIIRDRMHENDRSATGFLPPDEFEAVADQFFAHPDMSTRGWGTARGGPHTGGQEGESRLRQWADRESGG